MPRYFECSNCGRAKRDYELHVKIGIIGRPKPGEFNEKFFCKYDDNGKYIPADVAFAGKGCERPVRVSAEILERVLAQQG